MRALEVKFRGQTYRSVAGTDNISNVIIQKNSGHLTINLGGIISGTGKHYHWIHEELEQGEVIEVKYVELDDPKLNNPLNIENVRIYREEETNRKSDENLLVSFRQLEKFLKEHHKI